MNKTVAYLFVAIFASLLLLSPGLAQAEKAPTECISWEEQKRDDASLDMGKAAEALKSLFRALGAKDYKRAVQLYGGEYTTLRDWNPTVPPNDRQKLLKATCAYQLDCKRKIKRIVKGEQASPHTFRFTVEFMDDKGELFVAGPCCGASEEDDPPQSQFEYIVEKDPQGRMKVKGLPVYVP